LKIAAALLAASRGLSAAAADRSRRIEYADLPEVVQRDFVTHGISASAFGAYLDAVQADTARRLAEGPRDRPLYDTVWLHRKQ
jgi:hypothetical protein